MKLYIKQKVFSWKDRFTVKDESGEDRYYVEGEAFSWGRKLHVYDNRSREVMYIEKPLMSLLPRYRIYVERRQAAEVLYKSRIPLNCVIKGPEWTFENSGKDLTGQEWLHDYEITNVNCSTVARVTKKLLSWGDSYELDIVNSANEVLALGVLLVFDWFCESAH